ncbi:MAG: amino acid decarboxylase [Candidatus Solibacter usitatus]|nr:amino acid decarboxylase [Candidatus Solibacter usitatus]
MSPTEFRQFGHEVVDWIADYLAHPERYPVLPPCRPGDLTDELPASGPEQGEPMAAILKDFRDQIVPRNTQWNHPGFMAYFSITASGPGILGEMLAAALNPNGMVWKTSPAVVELEQVTLDWLRQWLGLPDKQFGIIFDTASVSSMHAIAAARERAAPEVRTEGGGQGLILYTSDQAHSSIEKGAIALGLGKNAVRLIGTDADFRMRTDLLTAAIDRDLAAGLRPFCVCATVGTTSTTSIDPVPAIADIAERYGLWLHVDAAYAGSAAIVPEFRHLLAGCERADSLTTNPHKWLFTPVDVSVLYTRHPEMLRRAFSLEREYLQTAADPRAMNYMDYGVPLGRRFRALKLWFVMRYYGHQGLAAIIRQQIGWAQELAAQIDAHPRFERMAPAPLSMVCFRLRGPDEPNKKLLEKINASGEFFLSNTVLRGKYSIRLAIGNMGTTRAHVQRAWQIIQESV